MRIRSLAGTVAIAAMLATAVAVPALAEDDPTLTVTGVVALIADGPDGVSAHIVAGNTVVPVEPDAVAEVAPGTMVKAQLEIPQETSDDLGLTRDVNLNTAQGEQIVEDVEQPFDVESLVELAAATVPAGPHIVDIAINTNNDGSYVQPTNTQVVAALTDASNYWVQNTGGVFPGFALGNIVRYSSSLSCTASDGTWAAEAAGKFGRSLSSYEASNSARHVLLVGECRHDGKAALGSVGDSLNSGGLVIVQANAFPTPDYYQFLNGLLVHEFGHNFSLNHANGPDLEGCNFASVPAFTQIANCGTFYYADDYSLMGFGSPMDWAPLLDVARRDQLGVSNSSTLATQAAGATATYSLTSLGASGGLKGVKVQAASGTYYVEFRNGVGEPNAYYMLDFDCVAEWEPSPTCTHAGDISPDGPGVRVLLLDPLDGSTRVEAVHSHVQDALFGEIGLDQGDWWISNAKDVNISVDTIAGDTATITVRTGTVPRAAVTSASVATAPVLGTPVGVTLGTLTPADGTVTYRWFRNGIQIAGATDATYTPKAADAGTQLSARVEVRAAGFAPAQRMTASAVVSPVKPVLSGAPKVGFSVGVSLGAWPDGFLFNYQWLRNGAPITGANGDTYTPLPADHAAKLSVRVTGVSAALGTVAFTSPASTVAKGVFTPPAPVMSGTARVGYTLTAVRGAWPTGTTFTYRWYANGVAISGAYAKTYKVPSTMVGKKLTVRVAGANPAFATVGVSSTSMGVPRVGKVKVYGTADVGRTLIASVGTWTTGTTFTYQWYVGGIAVPGATARTYVLPSTNVGQTVKVRVVGHKTGYTTVGVTSASTAKVTP